MFLLDSLGALLTLITLGFLGLNGYLLALLAHGEEAERDPLLLGVTACLCGTAQAVLLALGLGVVGLLRIDLALAIEAALALGLLRRCRRLGWGAARPLEGPWRAGLAAAWRRLREYPALSLLALHAAGSEALRGLLRPPLSWDSLMYHLLLAASWLQEHRITAVFGPHPIRFYGYQPADGSLWLWWWMAPSHSELYVNLAFFPQSLQLALATGAVARLLGARRHWPVASFLVLLVPTVIRFAATQYVDIFLGAALVAACFYTLRWLREPRWSDALLAGAGLGLTAGAKVLGLPYGVALALIAPLLARGAWRRRAAQLAAALAVLALLGSFFYVRNIALGAGPFAARCEGDARSSLGPPVPRIPRAGTVLDQLGPMMRRGEVLDAFLGISQPASLELGVGPLALLLPLPLLLLLLPGALEPGRGRAALLLASQIGVQLFFWISVPYAYNGHVFANVRYLIGALGLIFALGLAMAERHMGELWLRGIALALAVQSLLQLHAEMPRGVRLALGAADLAAVALALSPVLRAFCRRHIAPLAAAALAAAVACAPLLASFRFHDRTRALFKEYTTHKTQADQFALAWGWLERHAGNGTVAVASAPVNFFVYPAMGMRLERRAVYVNVNRRDDRNAADYPYCNPRVDPDAAAWLANLAKQQAHWLLVSRFTGFAYPAEDGWARDLPDRFALRFSDPNDRIYEVLAAEPEAGAQTRTAPGAPTQGRIN